MSRLPHHRLPNNLRAGAKRSRRDHKQIGVRGCPVMVTAEQAAPFGDAFVRLAEDARRHQGLTAAKEHTYLELAKAGDAHARHCLIEAHLYLAVRAAYRLIQVFGPGESTAEDLALDAVHAVIQAVDSPTAGLSLRLQTTAARNAYFAVMERRFASDRLIDVPRYQYDRVSAFLAEATAGATPEDLEALLELEPELAMFLVHPMPLTDELAEVIAPPCVETTETALNQKLDAALSKLSEREQMVIMLRYRLIDTDEVGDPNGKGRMTLEQVGFVLGVTRERVRQIEVRAIAKLKALVQGQRLPKARRAPSASLRVSKCYGA